MANNNIKYKQDIYIQGNAVRKLNPDRDYRNERIKREQEIQKRKMRRAARINQEKALHMNKGYAIFLSTAVVVTCIFSFFYIKLQSDVTQRMNQISRLESKVSALQIDNQETQKRIDTSVDLNHIKDVAVNQLGMVNAQSNQIVYYKVNQNDYMNQYGDIPSK